MSYRIIDAAVYGALFVLALIAAIPFLYIIAGSFAAPDEYLNKTFLLFPTQFSWEAYTFIFSSGTFVSSLLISIYITVVGTAVNLFFTVTMAYPLARRDLRHRRAILLGVLFTMLFSGGIIPLFLVIKGVGLLDSLWSLMLPVAISPFYLIILKNFFQQLPDGIEESAKIDGCNELQTLFRIVLPLSLPAIATFSLFYAVMHWNTFFHAIMFINDSTKWPIQVLLRQVVIISSGVFESTGGNDVVPPGQTIKMAVIVVSTIPIMLVYPFLQKHFAQGVLLGSVKG
ncbi:carbohydrate ABC transporter permease [Paenibacillus thalictri]|uniref:Carbohydrate ABC transporter permease n=1 Tax=Paenibacillus thalictri TaxID=2527873 RepID=A0A4V2J3F9_9BACL|nr:carbohydrate ABC transporter permease [Paenibacillus thalictri]TBL71622.1 carbohydrate ABC transporter permease [Paenibacillus thalictri]